MIKKSWTIYYTNLIMIKEYDLRWKVKEYSCLFLSFQIELIYILSADGPLRVNVSVALLSLSSPDESSLVSPNFTITTRY